MKVRVQLFTLLGFLLLLSSQQTSSQIHIPSNKQEPLFEHINTSEGLSSSLVNCMIQDKEGYIWFGTYDGLDRFDGISYKSYKNTPGDTTSIMNCNNIRCLFEDRAGNLWIGTLNELNKFEKSTGIFRHFKPGNSYYFSIQEDREGFLWIGTGKGLMKLNPNSGKYTCFTHDFLDSTSLMSDYVNKLFIDSHDNLWIGTPIGLDKFDRKTKTFIHYWKEPIHKLLPAYEPNKYLITAIYEDLSGTLWIGTMAGILEFYPETRKFTLHENIPQNPNTISHPVVSSICEVDNNTIWVGTYVGLNIFDKRTRKFTRIYHNDKVTNSLSLNGVSDILRERSGTMWVATFTGGVNKVDRTVSPFKRYYNRPWRETERFASASILDLDKARDGSIWIGTPTGLMNFDPVKEQFRNYKFTQNIRIVKEDQKGNLWIAFNVKSRRKFIKLEKNGHIMDITDYSGNKLITLINEIIEDDSILWACTEPDGSILKVNTHTNKFSTVHTIGRIIRTIYKDKSGLIWIGATNYGLLCFDPIKNKIVNHFLYDVRNPKSISGNSIFAIWEDDIGNLWAGTNGGLNKFDRKRNSFSHYTESDGLLSNRTDLIFPDTKKNLWIITLKGISKLNIKTGEIKNYDVVQGLITVGWRVVGCQSDNGEIYFDSPGGLVRFHPDSVKDNPYKPPIVISNITVMDKSILFGSEINLPYSDNNLSFEFAALSYVRPEKNLYAYKLEGMDDDWKYSGIRRRATYTNLDPGEYTFRVKGSNNDGVWNEAGTSIKIIIFPPWWRTKWAYVFYFLLVLSIIYFIWKAQVRRIRIKNEFQMSRFEAKKLHEVDEIKTRFFTNISHEFRTPLTLILGPALHLLERTKDEKTKEDLELIQRSAKKLNKLVDELLDISRIEAGEMKLKTSLQNLVSVVKEIILSFYSLAERKNITFKLNCDENEIIAYLDKTKFDKILTNILSNAFKFTPEGGKIEVGISSKEKIAEIIICDTGVGISKTKIDKIFDRFYQVDGSHTREQEGTGIGLALTKELIDLHKGKVEVESAEGKGSTFRLIFPLGKDHLNPEEICQEDSENENASTRLDEFVEKKDENKIDVDLFERPEKHSLLIVEDNADVRKYINGILKSQYNILEAKDGEEGLNKSFEQIPDLIISDIMMPKLDGIELCDKLKTDSRTSHIPVIMLTAKATINDKINGLEIGADDYIMKPFEAAELKARIKNLLDQRKRLHEHFRQYGLFEIEEQNITSLDKKFIQKSIEVININLSSTDLNVEFLADQLTISKSVLNKKLSALTGDTPAEFIKRIRLSKAAKLIEHNTGNISEIALEVGFGNPAYFAECFKKQFGISPSHYHHNSFNN